MLFCQRPFAKAYVYLESLTFWQRNPALFWATSAVSGVLLYHQIYIPLIFAFTHKKLSHRVGFFLVALAIFGFIHQKQHLPLPDHPIQGKGYLSVSKVRRSQGFQQNKLSYVCTLKYFSADQSEYYDLPCYVSVGSKNRLPADANYFIEGTLVSKGGYNLLFVRRWEGDRFSYSLAELRYRLKLKLKEQIARALPDKYTAAFLSALATGDVENTILGARFSITGLRHTLAISGFHYTYLVLTLALLLRFLLPRRFADLLLLCLITGYFLFIGESPSLSRAWLAATIYLLGSILGKSSLPINALGLALLVSTIINPISLTDIGLQLSFAATLAILCFYHPISSALLSFLPRRSLSEIKAMHPLDQAGWIILALLRKSVALSLAVSAVTTPLVIYHFQMLSFWGLFYNLFFPYLMAPILICLFLATLFFYIPALSTLLFSVSGILAKPLVYMALYGTGSIAGFIACRPSSPQTISLWLTALLLIGIALEDWRYQLTVKERCV